MAYTYYKTTNNKSSAIAEISDRGHNRHGMKRGGSCCAPLREELGLVYYNVAWAEVYFRTKWRLHPSIHLAIIEMGQKLGGNRCALFSGGSWVPIEHKVAWAEPTSIPGGILVQPAVWPQ